eukprot:COSAG02_NODE_1796_length_10904_cov_23.136603_9_plen_76_part_00
MSFKGKREIEPSRSHLLDDIEVLQHVYNYGPEYRFAQTARGDPATHPGALSKELQMKRTPQSRSARNATTKRLHH